VNMMQAISGRLKSSALVSDQTSLGDGPFSIYA